MTEGCGILCSGSIVFDTLVRPVDELRLGTTTFVETIESHIGGNGANTSIALARIGIPVRLSGTIGDDDHGKFVLAALRNAGVDTAAVKTVADATASTVALVNSSGGRQFLHRVGASAKAFPQPIDFTSDLTSGMRHYHLASLFILPLLRAHAGETLQRARQAGLSTSLDTNWDPLGRWMQDVGPCLPHLDYLFLNEDESRMLTGTSEPSEAARIVRERGVRTVVVKLGGRGCALYDGVEEIACPAFAVDAKDTTGAGDCFVAGFLAALHKRMTLREAARFGNAVAAMSVQRVGAVTGVPSYGEIEHWMRSARLSEYQGSA